MIDLHSHLVPDVDDGARSLEGARTAVDRMVAEGVERIVTTPHFDASLRHDAERFETRMAEIDAGFARLAEAVEADHPGVALGRGVELMLDDPFPDLSDPRVRLAGTRFVLVEWPRLRIPPSTPEVVARIHGEGWIPLIAHPERYESIGRNLALVSAWRRAGACLQMNHGSLLGRYGDEVRVAACRLLEGGWIDVLSSDFHARPHLPTFISEIREWFAGRELDDVFELLTEVNPARILADEHPDAVPSVTLERGLWDRITSFLRPGHA